MLVSSLVGCLIGCLLSFLVAWLAGWLVGLVGYGWVAQPTNRQLATARSYFALDPKVHPSFGKLVLSCRTKVQADRPEALI